MNPSQKNVVRLAGFALIGLQLIAVLLMVSSWRTLSSVDVAGYVEGSAFLTAALWPIVVAISAFMSLRALFTDSHYGWLGMIGVSVVSLPSIGFPAAAVILYVLLNPVVRRPMLQKIDAEWGLSSN